MYYQFCLCLYSYLVYYILLNFEPIYKSPRPLFCYLKLNEDGEAKGCSKRYDSRLN